MAEAAYENPLIPNARLRELYAGMLQARMIEKALPASRRVRSLGAKPHAANLIGLEACLVATSIDLGPGDLLSDAITGGTVECLRGTALAAVFHPAKSPARSKFTVGAGSALRLPPVAVIGERLWAAIGGAVALKAIGTAAKSAANPEVEADTPPAKRPGVAIVYLRPGEAATGLLRKSLTFAAEEELPLIFTVMPAPAMRGTAVSAKSPSISALSLACGVPGIAVDANDAVAIYRVAQESIGRARAGGGPALIECVPFVLEGGGAKQAGPEDAIAVMEQYLLRRKVASEAWINGQRRRFAKRLISK
jgi:TPP-dependent pyruvate/acetoin dehydrogenase alpha subunit